MIASDETVMQVLPAQCSGQAEPREQLPALRSPLDGLLTSHAQERIAIRQVVEFHKSNRALDYFFDAAKAKDQSHAKHSIDLLLDEDAAAKALDATYWARAINLTDVLDVMPADDRNKWHDSIQRHETPPFVREAVYTTIEDLLLRREEFFCQRIDGLFRKLSGNHVTNVPEGFSKRMILENLYSSFSNTIDYHRKEYIHDLRVIVATFMGRAASSEDATRLALLEIIAGQRFGIWHDFDGHAFRVRIYKKGTAHIEVHPGIAYRMNAVLAKLHPMAIPAQFRTVAPAAKEYALQDDLLPDHTVAYLAKMQGAWRHGQDWLISHPYATSKGGSFDRGRGHAEALFQQLGGVPNGRTSWKFDYDPTKALQEMLRTGRVPDESYQFFETQPPLVDDIIDRAEIEPHHVVLEPSAGRGAILQAIPSERRICVEVSSLRCAILRAKGYVPIQADFLNLMPSTGRVDRIVMNPPFSKGRAKEHVRHAATYWLKPDGRLVAVLPASLRDQVIAKGWRHSYSEILRDRFPGTGVAVVLLTLSPDF